MTKMAELETIILSHMPWDLPVYAALYRDVTNTNFLREQLLAGNTEFEYAFIDASTIVSRRHALAAVFRALNDYLNDRLKSRNVHSEIVFALSSNNNIGEAFRRFGISDTTQHLVVFKIGTDNMTKDHIQRHLSEHVHGTSVVFEDDNLRDLTDLDRVRKVHKLGSGTKGKSTKGPNGVHGDGVDERKEIEVQVLGLMALRGAT